MIKVNDQKGIYLKFKLTDIHLPIVFLQITYKKYSI